MEKKGMGKEKDKIVCKTVWEDPKMTEIFCKLVIEEINAGNRPLGTLNGRGYKNLGEKFFATTGKQYTQKQLKNRWDNLKILYNFWKSLWTNTGLRRNPDLGTVVASDEWWEDNTKGHMQREKKACRFGPPNCLEDMTIMYEKSQVSGLSACISGQESVAGSIPNGGGEEEEDHIEELQ